MPITRATDRERPFDLVLVVGFDQDREPEVEREHSGGREQPVVGKGRHDEKQRVGTESGQLNTCTSSITKSLRNKQDQPSK